MPSADHQRRAPWPDHLIRASRSPQLQLTLRNLYILPSRFGWLWLLACAALYLMGISSSSAAALLLGYGGLGLFLLAPFLTQFNLQGLELRCGEPPAGFAGQRLLYPLLVRTAVQRQLLRIRFQQEQESWVGSVPIGVSRVGVPWRPQQRGWQRPGRLRLESRAPLGLFVCWSLWEPEAGQLIYPARRSGPVATLPACPSDGTAAENAAPQNPGTDHWQDLRPHRPEEGRARLAWKQLARSGARLSKQFSDPLKPAAVLVPAPELAWERALEHLCDRCCRLAEEGGRFGLKIGQDLVHPGTGAQQLERCLTLLALAVEP